MVARRAAKNCTLAQLIFFFLLIEMILVPGSPSLIFTFGRDMGEVGKDTEGLETIRNLRKNFAWLLKKRSS